MNRIQSINNQLNSKVVRDSLQFLRLNELLQPQEEAIRIRARQFAENEIAPSITQFVETATFPKEQLKKMKNYNILSALLKAPYGEGASLVSQCLVLAEFARVDGGLATFFAVQHALVCNTLEMFASEEQKKKYLTKLRDLEMFAGWGLTEIENGSDASNLQTNVKQTQGGYILNGNKRWIGNGNQDFIIVFARNSENNQVEAYIVENKWNGVQSEPIKHKLSMRIVQNCQIYFKDVFVPQENKLENIKDWNSGPNRLLAHSRIGIPWVSVGLCMGVYDNVIKYITERKQFKVPLASFQLQQEKLVRIVATTQAVFLMALRCTQLAQEDKTTIGMSSGVKAWITLVTRDVARLGREMMGGNGIISDNYCIRAMADAETVYTYEGTYDINCLVAGRELTGIAAFKSK